MNTNKVCGEFPKSCYKAFKCKEYAEDFIYRGIFRMGCQLSYKAIEDEQRRDPTEGSGLTKEPGLVTSVGFSPNRNEKPIYIQEMGYQEQHTESGNARFCFCTCLPDVNRDHMKKTFGKYIVKINDPRKLAEDINDYFISTGQKFLIEGCSVVYNKGQKLDRKLTNNERVDLSYKQKPESFSRDHEFRIVAFKLGEPCTGECKFLSGQFEQVDPKCKKNGVNLGKQLNYTHLCES
jgi:hypothetical protein